MTIINKKPEGVAVEDCVLARVSKSPSKKGLYKWVTRTQAISEKLTLGVGYVIPKSN